MVTRDLSFSSSGSTVYFTASLTGPPMPRAAQLLGALHGLVDSEGGKPARNRDAELREDGLGLMLVDVHRVGG